MSNRQEFAVLRCGQCGRDKPHPHAFADPTFNTCWDCAWQEHLRVGHKRWWQRNVVKPAQKAARARYLRDETDRRITEAPTELLAKTVKPIPQETP